MSDISQACYTFEAALEMAVQMENEGFRSFLEGIRLVKNSAARQVLRDAALEKLEHRLQLERALVAGHIDGHVLEKAVPTMNLDYFLEKKELTRDADAREALAFAIHLKKGTLDFYRRMAQGCAGAPMASLFEQIANDETGHLQELEDLYEEHFLTEN